MKRSLILFLMITVRLTTSAQDIPVYSNIDWCTVHATVADKNGKMVNGAKGYLSLPGTTFTMATSVSDSAGNLSFLIRKPKTALSMVFQTDNPDTHIIVGSGNSMIKKFVFKPSGEIKDVFNDTLPFYGRPDKRYLLDDYTRFSSVAEILIEYIGEVKLKKQKGRSYFEVLNIPYNSFFTDPPLVLLDGVPVFDVDKLMSLDPLRIMKIEVVARKYYYGSTAWTGIVSFVSYDGGLAGYSLPPGAVVTEYSEH